ncbi:MAG: putative inorganic carbon transporter subunit DabA, partial [Ferruginibacter sp.]
MGNHSFNEADVIHELKHFLPSQQALKDFIHHNSLHAFQHMKFYDAIFKASKIFGFQVHLQLPEYRQMYETGRIRQDVLEMVIANKKGKAFVKDWKEKLMSREYYTINHPRIGALRSHWKSVYKLDLDN